MTPSGRHPGLSALAIVGAAVVWCVACGGIDDGVFSGAARTENCVPGSARACLGPRRCIGAQVCLPSGKRYHACVCGASVGEDGPVSNSGSGDAGGDGPTSNDASDDGPLSNDASDGPTSNDASDDGPLSNGASDDGATSNDAATCNTTHTSTPPPESDAASDAAGDARDDAP